MRMYMQLPQGPTLFLCTILLAPAGGTLHKVRSHSSLRRHRGEEQVQVAGGHRRSDRRRVLHAHRLSDDCVGHPNDDVRVDDGGMEGNAGRGGAGRVHPRRRRCLYLSSDTSFRGATLLRCLWHLNKNVKEKLGSVLGSEYAVSSILSVCRYDSTWEQRGCVVPVKKTVSFGASPGVATPSTKALAIILPFVWVPDAMN